MGAGKSVVLAEASDILAARRIPHAALDLDALGLAYLSSASNNDGIMLRNLESVCKNYAALGVKRLLLARAVEGRAELAAIRDAVKATTMIVCRLTASIRVMEERVKKRELGLLQGDLVARVARLNAILDQAQLEDFSVASKNRAVTDIAREMLARAGLIPD